MPAPTLKKVSDVVMALQRAKGDPENRDWGRAVFLIGAGCSVSAGIPLGAEIAGDCATQLVHTYSNESETAADGDEAIAWLKERDYLPEGINIKNAYGTIFEEHYSDPAEQQKIIRDAVDKSNGHINWSHICLGQLVKDGFINTVLTTNFDQLVLDGIVRTGIIPVVADGIESLARIRDRPDHPQVIHVHGSLHTYSPRNSPDDLHFVADDLQSIKAMTALISAATVFVIVGYAGGEEGIMDLLTQATKTLGDKVIYWVQYSDNPDALSPQAEELLNNSGNAGLIVGQDADSFFFSLMQGLGIGQPDWVKNPITYLQSGSSRISNAANNSDIATELQRYKEDLASLEECFENARSGLGEREQAIRSSREARLRGDFEAALDHLLAADDVPVEEWRQLGTLAFDYGRSHPSPAPLQVAVRARKEDLNRLPPDHSNLEWAAAQNSLGTALQALGERESGADTLQQAIAAHRAALEEWTRERVPLQWAMVQNNLGNVFSRLGERESDPDNLRLAIAAYRAAQEEQDRERVPLDWAGTQNNLGTVLATLGERERDPDTLRQAVAAYRAALEEWTRERVPLDWAGTQNNLGSALATLGELESGTDTLQQAIAAHRAALEEWSHERVPLQWAGTQNNLSNALRVLGQLESGTDSLQQAIVASRATMEEWTRERVPRDWAGAQNNLGNVLRALGEREDGSERLQQAVDAYRAALNVFENSSDEYSANLARRNLALTEALLAERRDGTGSG